MNRVKLTLAYDGTAYHGWQVQENAVTVQGVLQDALREIFQMDLTLHGCSRTDAGVHAKEFVCHVDLPRTFPLDKLPFAMNALMPRDISVLCAEAVPDSFHARFSCKGKEYAYRLLNRRIRDPFEKNRAGFWPTPLSEARMNAFAQDFVGTHDFSAFMATGSEMEDTVRRIDSFSVTRNGDLITFTVRGTGFLYNMVRIMVGTLIYAEIGRLDRPISQIIHTHDRTLAGITMPPQGLYLIKPFFD